VTTTAALLNFGDLDDVLLALDLDRLTVRDLVVRVFEADLRAIGRHSEHTGHARDENEERSVHGHSASLHSSSMGHPVYNGY